MQIVDQSRRLCALAMRAGRTEACPGAECPLWEDGGCALERLAAEGEVNVDEWPVDEP